MQEMILILPFTQEVCSILYFYIYLPFLSLPLSQDEYVDWVGASSYHFGTTPPYKENTIPAPGDFTANLNAAGLYATYAVSKNKPMLIAETGAAYHPNIPSGASELAIKQAWWRQSITSLTFLDQYPMVKLFCMFEFSKLEGDFGDDLRDFRVSHSSLVRDAFQKDFAGVKDRYVLATYVPPPPRQNYVGVPTTTVIPQGNGAISSSSLTGLVVVASLLFYSYSLL